MKRRGKGEKEMNTRVYNKGFAAKIEEELFSTFESSHSYEIMYYYYELFSQVFRGEGHSGSECTTTGAVPSSVYPTIIASNNSPRRRRRRRNNNNKGGIKFAIVTIIRY